MQKLLVEAGLFIRVQWRTEREKEKSAIALGAFDPFRAMLRIYISNAQSERKSM